MNTTLATTEPNLPLVLFIGGNSNGARLAIPPNVSVVKMPKMTIFSGIRMKEKVEHETYREMGSARASYRFFVIESMDYGDAMNLLLDSYPTNKTVLGVIEA